MRKEVIFPLVVGLIIGALVVVFWQFTATLNAQRAGLAQLEQVTAQNSATINDVVNFINQATNPQGAAPTAPTE